MDVNGQDKGHGKNIITTSKDKEGKEGENNLKEVVMEDETGVAFVGRLKKTEKRGEISFLKSELS